LNWKKGVTGIRNDAVAEGFLNSIEIHELKFSKIMDKNSV